MCSESSWCSLAGGVLLLVEVLVSYGLPLITSIGTWELVDISHVIHQKYRDRLTVGEEAVLALKLKTSLCVTCLPSQSKRVYDVLQDEFYSEGYNPLSETTFFLVHALEEDIGGWNIVDLALFTVLASMGQLSCNWGQKTQFTASRGKMVSRSFGTVLQKMSKTTPQRAVSNLCSVPISEVRALEECDPYSGYDLLITSVRSRLHACILHKSLWTGATSQKTGCNLLLGHHIGGEFSAKAVSCGHLGLTRCYLLLVDNAWPVSIMTTAGGEFGKFSDRTFAPLKPRPSWLQYTETIDYLVKKGCLQIPFEPLVSGADTRGPLQHMFETHYSISQHETREHPSKEGTKAYEKRKKETEEKYKKLQAESSFSLTGQKDFIPQSTTVQKTTRFGKFHSKHDPSEPMFREHIDTISTSVIEAMPMESTGDDAGYGSGSERNDRAEPSPFISLQPTPVVTMEKKKVAAKAKRRTSAF